MLKRHHFYSKLLFSVLFFIAHSESQAAEVCELQFTDCPEQFKNDTIIVPQNVVAMSASISACNTAINSPGGSSGPPPSIMFVIDHSGSMTGANTDPNDRTGSRFTVTNALLDSIYKVQPNAEVGITVFSGHLYFDITSTQYFASYFSKLPKTYDNTPNQAYLKLLKLNGNFGGRTGIDIIKDVLQTKSVTANNSTYIDLTYKPGFDPTLSTNINIGFIAAKDAMSKAVNPPERQFVIFLSDGEPMGNNQAGLPSNDFMTGKEMATTFTVFFTSSNSAPRSLVTMTDNIRDNGYSSSNPKSDLWAIQTSHTALLTLLMKNVFNEILIARDPRKMVFNGVQSVTFNQNSFIFPDRFPLQANITSYNTITSYNYTDPQTGVVRDTNVTVNFSVQRSSSAVKLPAGVALNCWQQPDLQFFYNGLPISAIDEEMKQVQIKLNPNGESIKSATVSISSSLETGNFTLNQSNGEWAAQVNRATSTNALKNDNVIQNVKGDSLIVIYRNPKIPLDTVRVAIRIVDKKGPEIHRAIYYPGNNGTFDTINVLFTEPVRSTLLTNVVPGASIVYTDSGVINNSKLKGSSYTGTYTSDYVQDVRILVPKGSVVPLVDSLSLVGLSTSVSDQDGNNPSINNSKKPIEWGIVNSISIAISTNPFIPGKTELPSVVLQQYADIIEHNTGVFIEISSLKPFEEQNGSYGTLQIYDAVGNLITSGLKIGKGTSNNKYGIHWDGKNKNKRFVGSGTYLIVIQMIDTQEKRTSFKVKIGVKR